MTDVKGFFAPVGRDGRPRSAAVAIVEREEAGSVELAGAELWHLIVLDEGMPVARLDTVSPGPGSTPALSEAAIARWGDRELARRRLEAELGARIGEPAGRAPVDHANLSVSVVVCTHRRPQYIASVLGALGDLDPAPDEIVIVDNDPGEHDCRAAVSELGARYVREDRRGLDNARNRGAREATGDIVVFTDDDCVPSPGWLASVPRTFARPDVAAATGPAFPYRLDTPAQIRAEQQASLARGLWPIAFDWRLIAPAQAAAAGVGANMAFRREELLALGPEPFPPELDAGTPTQSGGDIALLGELLARGRRLAYEPEMFVRHQHRPDWRALEGAARGYGTGLASVLTMMLLRRGELSVPRAGAWLVEQYLIAQARRAMGSADAVWVRIAAEHLRGAVVGPARWVRSFREQRRLSDSLPASSKRPLPGPEGELVPVEGARSAAAPAEPRSERGAAPPAMSVIVPTSGRRPASLRRCLAALGGQRGAPDFELVLVDDGDPASVRSLGLTADFPLRVIETGGAGAAAARNAGAAAAAGELLVFVDDDVIAEPELLATHAERQGAASGVVLVGSYPPRPRGEGLASQLAALWWFDAFDRMERAVAHTFVSALTGNMSVRAADFEASGGFDEAFPRSGREDWEWGIRLRERGLRIEYEPEARAWHEYELSTEQRLRAAELEGHGDALILARHPGAIGSLPVWLHRPRGLAVPAAVPGRWLWSSARARRAALRLLDALERAKLRGLWWKQFERMQGAAYLHGLHKGGVRLEELPEPEIVPVELDAADPVAAPGAVAPIVRLTRGGREIAVVAPVEGCWGTSLAEQLSYAVPWSELGPLARERGWLPGAAEGSRRAAAVDVLVDSGARHGVESLEAAGARVRRPDGGGGWWERSRSAMLASDRELVACVLPGIRPDERWLAEALLAFDGERVAAAFGAALTAPEPLAPVHLAERWPAWRVPTSRPCYLIVRTELLAEILPPPGLAPLAALVAVVRRATEAGWVVAERATHGLSGPGPSWAAVGRAWGSACAAESLDPRLAGDPALGARLAVAARGAAGFGFEALRVARRPRSGPAALVAGAAAGYFGGAARARPRG